MASIKDLKKDVEYLVFELVSDCLTFSGVHPGEHVEELSDIIEDAIGLRNDLLVRISGSRKSAADQPLKKHFNEIRKDLFSGIDKLFDRLSQLSQAN